MARFRAALSRARVGLLRQQPGAPGAHGFFHETRRIDRIEEIAVQELSQRVDHLAGTIELLARADRFSTVMEEVAALSSDAHLTVAVLIDLDGRILASTRMELVQEPIDRALPELAGPIKKLLIRDRNSTTHDVVDEGRTLVAAAPVLGRFQPRATQNRVGTVILVRDCGLLRRNVVGLQPGRCGQHLHLRSAGPQLETVIWLSRRTFHGPGLEKQRRS